MQPLKLTSVSAALVFALACGRGDEDFTDATPDMESLALEISNQAAEGVTTAGLQAGTSASGLATGPEFLRNAREAVANLNGMLRRARRDRPRARSRAREAYARGPRRRPAAETSPATSPSTSTSAPRAGTPRPATAHCEQAAPPTSWGVIDERLHCMGSSAFG